MLADVFSNNFMDFQIIKVMGSQNLLTSAICLSYNKLNNYEYGSFQGHN